jgi:cytochrome c556
MKLLRALLALAMATTLVSCQAAQNILSAPVNMVKTVLGPIGRTVGIGSGNTRIEDLRIEAHEVREAVAAVHQNETKADPAGPVVVQR